MKRFVYLLILLLIVFLSYGKITQMYFWVDDWAMVYKLVFPEEKLSNMEPGIFGGGAYRYLLTPFHLLYPFLGFNAFPYFLLGWFLYFFASCSVYLLIKELTKKDLVGISAAAIFASGFIGSHALFRLTNFYQTVGATMFICLTVWLFVKYLKSKKVPFYLAALGLFSFTLETILIRSHGLFLTILAASLFIWITKETKISLKSILLKNIPFLFIFLFLYFLDPRLSTGSSQISVGVKTIFSEPQLFNNLLITFSNTLIPDQLTHILYTKFLTLFSSINSGQPLIKPTLLLTITFVILVIVSFIKQKKLEKIIYILIISGLYIFVNSSATLSSSLWNPRAEELFTAMLGGGLLITFLYISSFWKKSRQLLIPLALIYILANSIVFFIFSPNISIESTSRYLLPSFVGVSLLYSVTFFHLVNVQKAVLGIVSVCLILLYYSNKEVNYIVSNISIPDKAGYSLLLKEVEKVDEDTIFYIETENEAKYKGSYLGSFPQLGISALFHYKGVTTIADSYDHLFYLLENDSARLDKIHTYFYGKDGYKSTTSKLREVLKNGGEEHSLNNWAANLPYQVQGNNLTTRALIDTNEKVLGVNPTIETELNYDSLIPSELEFTLIMEPLNISNFPYFDVTKQYLSQIGLENISKITPLPTDINGDQIITTLQEEAFIREFRGLASVQATSSYKTTGTDYLIDAREDTNWGAENNIWNAGNNPQDLILDLGSFMGIRKLVWLNHHYMATPTVYSIYSSTDGIQWKKEIDIRDGKRLDGGEIIENEFSGIVYTRFLKMAITETFGGLGYPPAVREMWVSNVTDRVDPKLRDKILECVSCYFPDSATAKEIIKLTKSVASARIWWETDKQAGFSIPNSSQFWVYLDGLPHRYKIILPANGTKFKKLKIDGFQIPTKISLSDVSIRSLRLDEIDKTK